MLVTAELLQSWDACWTPSRIAAHPLGSGATPTQIAADESISLDDRLWVLAKCLWHCDPIAARLFAIECAESVAHLAGDEDDQAQFLGLCAEMREMAIAGVPDGDPNWAAARDAARDAAWAAAWAAARAAARAAAWDAAWDAAWAAAWAAALRKKIASILEWLGDEATIADGVAA
jgi:hypothetical protein